jgi:anti-sigma factor RsiW
MKMSEEQFAELALKALTGEAEPAERERLDAALRGDAALAEEFAILREAFQATRQAAPLLSPAEAELPAYRLAELRGSVSAAFPVVRERPGLFAFLRPFLVPSAALACACVVAMFFLGGSPRVEIGMYAPDSLRGEKSLRLDKAPHAVVRTFQSDAAFTSWLDTPLPHSVRARIWIDEEHDLIHIVRPSDTASPRQESEPLPPSDEQRAKRLSELVDEISR